MAEIKLSDLKLTEGNPRLIKDEKFKKLVKSISEFPEMMPLRPIIVDEHMVVLGGNMRLRALNELKYKTIPSTWIKVANGLTDEQKKEFIIKDNVGFGSWDFDVLANEWNEQLLIDWGVDIWNPATDENISGLFTEGEQETELNTNKIVLQFTDEEYSLVVEAFEKIGGSREQAVFKLLGL